MNAKKIIFTCFFLVLILSSYAQADSFLAGVSKVDITPTTTEISAGKIRIGGMNLGYEATGVHDLIFARSLYLGQNDGKAGIVLLVLDLPAISNRSIEEIKRRASSLTRLPKENVFVSVTHTHSAPDILGLWGNSDPSYKKRVENLAVTGIYKAYRNRKFSNLFISKISGPNYNRRLHPTTDNDLVVLDFRRVNTNERIGTLVNFAAHPVTNLQTNSLISADFCGALVSELEESLGGTSIYVNGAIGDVEPLKEYVKQGFAAQKKYASLLADQAIKSMKNQELLTGNKIVVSTQKWQTEIKNNLMLAAYFLGRLDHQIDRTSGFAIDAIIHSFAIGEMLEGVTVPGEALTNIAIPFKEKMQSKYKLFFGLTDGFMGYIVPENEWQTGRNGNYEEGVSVSKIFATEVDYYLNQAYQEL